MDDERVAPFTGAWIEIPEKIGRAAGLDRVAPFAGAWIEIMMGGSGMYHNDVAPFAGTWIEIVASSGA